MEFSKPQEEHRFLEKLLGDWLVISASGMEGCDVSADSAARWTETGRALEGLWYVVEGRGSTPDGTPGSTLLTLGYDPALGHYVGTWVGSMMAKLWIYKGWVEPDGKTLILEAEGPDFEDPSKTAIFHDVITFIDDDHRSFSGSVRQPDGSFKTFMTNTLERQS